MITAGYTHFPKKKKTTRFPGSWNRQNLFTFHWNGEHMDATINKMINVLAGYHNLIKCDLFDLHYFIFFHCFYEM